jgi:hypothetical protein
VNPKIAADYGEVEWWLRTFATSHAKRESLHVEAEVDTTGGREGRAYGLRVVLGGRAAPPWDEPPVELTFSDVVEGRNRFAWCESLAERVRALARALVAQTATVRPS